MIHEARLKPCNANGWKLGRWREVEKTRTTNDKDDCRGGGVPIGARIVIYADEPKSYFCGEGTYDFDWNVEERTIEETIENVGDNKR